MKKECQVYVGMKLYKPIYNKEKPLEVKEYTVSKVGNKYFEVEQDYGYIYKYNISNLKYENKMYSQSNIQFYKTEQEILDKHEKEILYNKLRKHFSYGSNYQQNVNTLDELRQVAIILKLQ